MPVAEICTTHSDTSGNVVLPKPTGLANGDRLIAAITWEDMSAPGVGLPSGWSQVPGSPVIDSTGNDMGVYVAYKDITDAGSEPSSYTFTFSSYHWAACVRVSSPGDMVLFGNSRSLEGGSDTEIIAGYDAVADNSLALAFIADYAHGGLTPAPTGWANITDNGGRFVFQVADRDTGTYGEASTGRFGTVMWANAVLVIEPPETGPPPVELVIPTAVVASSALPPTISTGAARASVRGHATTNGTSATSVAVNVPTHSVGDLLIALCAHDNPGATAVATVSTDWVRLYHETQGSNVLRLTAFAKIATGSDALQVTGAAQDYAIDCLAIANHGVTTLATDIKWSAPASATTGNANPPSLDAGSVRDWLDIAHCAIDMTATGDTLSAVPASYTESARLKSANSTSSTAVGVAWRQVSTQTEDPGTFTNTSRPWIAATLAIPPIDTSTTLTVPTAVIAAAALPLALAGVGDASVALPPAASTITARTLALAGDLATLTVPAAQLGVAARPIELTALAATVELVIPPAAVAALALPAGLSGSGAVVVSVAPAAVSAVCVALGLAGAATAPLVTPAAILAPTARPITLTGTGTAAISIPPASALAAAVAVQLSVGLGSTVELVLAPALVATTAAALALQGAGSAALAVPRAAVGASAVAVALHGADTAQLALPPATAPLSARPVVLVGDQAALIIVPAVALVVAVPIGVVGQPPAFAVGEISGAVEHARISGSVEIVTPTGSIRAAQIGE